ncbi:MAG: PAS domain S-box protein [Spirochaetota bacterium]
MEENESREGFSESLRKKAEEILEGEGGPDLEVGELRELIHELKVYQVELGAQNKELIRTREHLSEAKDRYQALFQAAPVGYLVLDEAGEILEVNSAGIALLGKPLADVRGTPFEGHLETSFRRHLSYVLENLSSQTGNTSFKARIPRKDTDPLWVRADCSLLRQEVDGIASSILVTLFDITATKENERKLLESRKAYSDIVNTASSIIAMMDLSGRLTFINPYGLDFFGFREDEIIGRPIIGTIVPEVESNGRNLRQLFARITEDPDGIMDIEHENTRADGSRAWVHWKNRAVRNPEGKITGFLGVGQDITARKRAEEIIRRDKDKLEAIVRERTDQLMAARRELDRSRRLGELGRLASSVAHELRRPLASLKLSLYNIRNKRTNPAIDLHINRCEEKIFEGERIINNLLESADLKEPRFSEIDLLEVITECLEEVETTFTEHAVQVNQDLDTLRGVFIQADPLHIRGAVSNIIQNGFEALTEGSGTITVTGFADDKSAGFSVADTGTGIPEAEIEHVFEPFYTTKHRGVGLGLSVTQEIIGLHSGSLEIRSRTGEGTTVTVTLPRIPD